MDPSQTYVLSSGVQVRRENFGLLFYNYHGLRLYFVPIGDLIDSDFFNGIQTVGNLVDAIHLRKNRPKQWIHARIEQILQLITNKGLIHGESIC
jgi:putative mycofactocin binding protein MftB